MTPCPERPIPPSAASPLLAQRQNQTSTAATLASDSFTFLLRGCSRNQDKSCGFERREGSPCIGRACPCEGGRCGLAAAPRAIARKGARARAQARPQRRRNVLQRGAATGAGFLGAAFDAQPMAAGGASRVQALHSPAGQILHRASFSGKDSGGGRKRSGQHPEPLHRAPNLAGILRRSVWCVKRECIPLVGVRVR